MNTFRNKDKNDIIITCPECGTQYLAAEIIEPLKFIGKPTFVERDMCKGRIVDYCGVNMDTEINYVCDNCNTPFVAVADIVFRTYANKKKKFETVSITKLTPVDLFK